MPPIELKLARHTFQFRRLTWADEVAFSQQHPGATRVDYAAFATTLVDGKPLTFDQARQLLLAMPRPIRERVLVFYMGSLPGRRAFTAEVPWAAPEPVHYQRTVDDEADAKANEEDDLLNRTFGAEEVAEAQALALNMAKGTKFAGVGPSLDTGGSIDEEPPKYHVVV